MKSLERRIQILEELIPDPEAERFKNMTDAELWKAAYELFKKDPEASEKEVGWTPEMWFLGLRNVSGWRNIYPDEFQVLTEICNELRAQYPDRWEAFQHVA